MAVKLEIGDDEISSPCTAHRAVRITHTWWRVTWLPYEQRLTRNQAINAMIIASAVAAAPPGRPGRRDPWYTRLATWAGQLGLDADTAIAEAGQLPKWSPDQH
jgi:hypothetical protein